MLDLIIIGAGPAGLFSAQRVAATGLKVLVLEKNNKAGKKLLVTGSGKCNLTNAANLEQFLTAYGKKAKFVAPSLRNFSNTDLIAFFASHALSLIELHAGKIFPQTMRASDVLKTVLAACETSGVLFSFDSSVSNITHQITDAGSIFSVRAVSQEYQAKNILISCGGSSWPVTGSTGDGNLLAQNLGHSIVEPKPALTSVLPVNYDCASCAGFALSGVRIFLWREGKKIGERNGDVLFTHLGISGPGILDFSRHFNPSDEISIDLCNLPNADSELLSVCASSPKKTVKNILCGLGLSEALALVLLKRASLSAIILAAELDRKGRKSLSSLLESFRFTIKRLGGFDEAMATAGGIDTDEVNAKTMESRLVSGLYFAGEVLDVDGDTGGYNLQFAFSSGALAADHIIKMTKDN
ncbi:MAG TPA: NAD(P)/FAD-dependent oxidoreductase [Treponema sp.]|nr:NAD(P)/FAD-dependent oxidoreductase [Treponema sp.]